MSSVVAQEQVAEFWVSTVQLPYAHDEGEYETMVFFMPYGPSGFGGSWADLWVSRCATHEQAVEQHAEGVAWAQKEWDTNR